ncbi:hypothetical protein JQ557_19040 [Bradyrhizobium sp. U87765 SZCCT0131]|uniref:hypothetical protein n=1 Tax=unclassified Bradyrhizobium TaxID=2631580 RepID=UPI001BA5A899|nr:MULTISPECIES: hypothetical protein [unclassified Bradyrhizobium]MBR1220109.1 hypothetical protein [Bradyrhizobium sp. U87765 SZCCT0131]MBR1263435.1 hypothetical protein [Bradyrhizobium sp. U87765 SZCCT0134]MBR1309004.1 hypothetical protein [Bradyrhizobium sp. U87765 SZCCT0110]MBR1323767.1 hypothetical protein [Bradyrhizobium sp. U87765 SZCCT0109]MBR1349319.1 hypothetical protein [Bradyrhizobium sp. U87765 SZCCT0048]
MSRRLPVFALIYALALQGIAAGWFGAGHGMPGLQGALGEFGVLCRQIARAAERPDGLGPTSPAHDHDCAQACLTAVGGGVLAEAAGPAPRRMAIAGAPSPNASPFAHLPAVAAAFAARAPPLAV